MGCGSSSTKYAVKEEKKPASPPSVLERDLRPLQKDEVETVIKWAQALDVDFSFEVLPLTSEAWGNVTRADEALKAAAEQLDGLLSPYDPAQPGVLRICNIGERETRRKTPLQSGAWDACIAAQDALMANPNDEASQRDYDKAVADLADALANAEEETRRNNETTKEAEKRTEAEKTEEGRRALEKKDAERIIQAKYYAERRVEARRDAILSAHALAMRRKHLLLECLKDPGASAHVRSRVLQALSTLPESAGVLESVEEMTKAKELVTEPGSAGTVVFAIASPVDLDGNRRERGERICAEFDHRYVSVEELVEKSELEEKHLDELPTDVLLALLAKEMDARGPGTPFLLDGFPRSQSDLIAWDKKFGVAWAIDFCLFFTLPQFIAEAAVAELEDAEEALEDTRERYAKFGEVTGPLIQQFAEVSMLVDIDTSYPEEQIWKEVSAAFSEGIQEAQVLAMQRDESTRRFVAQSAGGDEEPTSVLDE